MGFDVGKLHGCIDRDQQADLLFRHQHSIEHGDNFYEFTLIANVSPSSCWTYTMKTVVLVYAATSIATWTRKTLVDIDFTS